jgi:signal transduction histidine kinase
VDKEIYVLADRNMVVSILQNIITNAIKFTNQGGNIDIKSKVENGEVIISVTDDGVGIKPEYIEKIFRIDHDTTSTGTMNETGTGLGLLLTKEMVELNGGKIYVESEFGKGSTFSVSFPLA